MNFRVKYCTTRSKFENLSCSSALTQFVKYISVYTSPSRDALISSFWMNIDDNPTPFQMAENSNISIDSQWCGHGSLDKWLIFTKTPIFVKSQFLAASKCRFFKVNKRWPTSSVNKTGQWHQCACLGNRVILFCGSMPFADNIYKNRAISTIMDTDMYFYLSNTFVY